MKVKKSQFTVESVTFWARIFERYNPDHIYEYPELEYVENANIRSVILPDWIVDGVYKITIERIED